MPNLILWLFVLDSVNTKLKNCTKFCMNLSYAHQNSQNKKEVNVYKGVIKKIIFYYLINTSINLFISLNEERIFGKYYSCLLFMQHKSIICIHIYTHIITILCYIYTIYKNMTYRILDYVSTIKLFRTMVHLILN